MPAPAYLLLLATLLPLAALLLLAAAGRRLGTPLAGWIATALIAASLTCSLIAVIAWFSGGHYLEGEWGKGQLPIFLPIKWLPIGVASISAGISQDHLGFLDLAIYIDSLTILLFVVVTLVALLVHLFAIGFMWRDPNYHRFFSLLALLSFSMLSLLLAGTLLQMVIFWELLAAAGFLLIGFWQQQKASVSAAVKFFTIGAIGDMGLWVGLGVLVAFFGNLSLPDLWAYLAPAGSGQSVDLPGGLIFGTSRLTLVGVGLFIGIIGRSALFPLQVWLADETEGPAPASALIQSVTVVASGIYLLARVLPIFTPSARLLVAIIGVTTLLVGALVATAQREIKTLLSFLTTSHLGLIALAMGNGSWGAGVLHLVNQGFTQALLFLGAGSVVFALRQPFKLNELGGLGRKLPVTAVTFAIAGWCVAGMPLLTHFSSVSTIVGDAGAIAAMARNTGHARSYSMLLLLPALSLGLIAFAITRCWMLVFFGAPRVRRLHEHAHEHPILWFPMGLLAILSVFGARVLDATPLLESSARETEAIVREVLSKDEFPRNQPNRSAIQRTRPLFVNSESLIGYSGVLRFSLLLMRWGGAAGTIIAMALYWRGTRWAKRVTLAPPVVPVQQWLLHRMYFAELYESVFAATLHGFATLANWVDRLFDAALENFLRFSTDRGTGFHSRAAARDSSPSAQKVSGLMVRRPALIDQRARSRTLFLLVMILSVGAAGAFFIVKAILH